MKRIILLFALSCFCIAGFCQSSDLLVKGIIREGKKPLKESTIIIYKDNKVMNQITSRDGKFELSLAYDDDFVLEFSKKGYVSKRINFNTKNITSTTIHYGYEFSQFGVLLFKDKEGTDYSNFQDPVALISYCECVDKFVHKKL